MSSAKRWSRLRRCCTPSGPGWSAYRVESPAQTLIFEKKILKNGKQLADIGEAWKKGTLPSVRLCFCLSMHAERQNPPAVASLTKRPESLLKFTFFITQATTARFLGLLRDLNECAMRFRRKAIDELDRLANLLQVLTCFGSWDIEVCHSDAIDIAFRATMELGLITTVLDWNWDWKVNAVVYGSKTENSSNGTAGLPQTSGTRWLAAARAALFGH